MCVCVCVCACTYTRTHVLLFVFLFIKVRLQTMPVPTAGESPRYAGTYDCAKKTIQREGFRGLYKGSKQNIFNQFFERVKILN